MIKSQDDCSKELKPRETRSVDVLVEAISKLETTTKQLEIALKIIDAVMQDEYIMETMDGGLSMYLYTGLEKIKELEK